MKQSTTFALATFFALSAAIPLERRNMVTVVDVVNVVETVDVTTTIFVPPGDPRLAAYAMNPQNPAPVTAQTTSAAAPYVPPQTSATATPQPAPVVPQIQQKEAMHSAPASSSAPAAAPVVTPPKAVVAAAAPAVEKAAAPVQQQAAPAKQQAPPVSSPSTPSPSTSASASSRGACGDEGGACVASDVTTFDGGPGSCGTDDASRYGEMYFALAHEMMGPGSSIGTKPANSFCGRTAEITYNGKTLTGTLTDKCISCTGASLDLSLPLFEALFGAKTGVYHDVSYKFTNGPQPVATS